MKFSTSKWCLQILSQHFRPLKTFPIYTIQLWTLLDDLWPVIPFADPPPFLSIDLIVTEALKYPGILPISNKKPGIVHNCTLHWVHFPTWNSMNNWNEFNQLSIINSSTCNLLVARISACLTDQRKNVALRQISRQGF